MLQHSVGTASSSRMNANDCGIFCWCKVLGCIPCKSPDEIGKVLRIESRQLESGLLLEGV